MRNPVYRKFAICFLGIFVFCACADDDGSDITDPGEISKSSVSEIGESTAFRPDASMEELTESGAISVGAGNVRYFIGYRQVSPQNQDPILAKYVDGELVWVRIAYETTGDDSRGYGLIWDGAETLYAIFSVTGTQGPSDGDYRRFATKGWHKSYGQGGGAKATVAMKINPNNGEPQGATYLMGRLANGNANTLIVKNLQLLNNGNLLLNADCWYSPLRVNKEPFECEGDAPFDYTLELSGDLTEAKDAQVTGCI